FLPPTGRACASKFFELPSEKRPTAIFAASDQMAYGILVAAEEYALSIPRDVALVGFDDDAPSMHTRPALTTIRQPYFEMGQRAIELLLSMLDAPGISAPSDVVAPLADARLSTQLPGTSKGAEDSMPPTDAPGSVQPIRIQLPTTLIVRESCGAYRSPIAKSFDKTTL